MKSALSFGLRDYSVSAYAPSALIEEISRDLSPWSFVFTERLIVLLLRQTLPCHFSVYIIHLFSYAPAGYTHLSETVSQPAESPSEIFNFLMCVELYTCFFKMATGISIPIFYQNGFSLCVFHLIRINPHTLHTVCLSSDDPYISSSHGHRCPTGKEEQSGSEWP